MVQPRTFIAVLDDEPQFCKALGRLLKTHTFEVATFTSGEDFLSAAASRLPDILLLDLHMPDLNGFEILERLSTQPPLTLVITGHDQPGNAERVRALGAVDYLLKPLNETQLLAAIGKAMKSFSSSNRPDQPKPKQNTPQLICPAPIKLNRATDQTRKQNHKIK